MTPNGQAGEGQGGPKNYISPFGNASGKQKVSVLLFALVERFGVTRIRDFCTGRAISNLFAMADL